MEFFTYVPEGAPQYDPDAYLGSEWNCYAYALRLRDHGYATPGELRSVDHVTLLPSEIHTEEIERRIVNTDGLERIRPHGSSLNDHVIAAEILQDPGTGEADFHFYSFDADGHWSCKMGGQPVLRELFPDPHSPDFIGFFKVPTAGINFYPRLKEINDWRAMGLDI